MRDDDPRTALNEILREAVKGREVLIIFADFIEDGTATGTLATVDRASCRSLGVALGKLEFLAELLMDQAVDAMKDDPDAQANLAAGFAYGRRLTNENGKSTVQFNPAPPRF